MGGERSVEPEPLKVADAGDNATTNPDDLFRGLDMKTLDVPSSIQDTARSVLPTVGFGSLLPTDKVAETDAPTASQETSLKVAPSPYVLGEVFNQFSKLGLTSWTGTNDAQRALIEQATAARAENATLPKDILDGTGAVGSVDPVNDFLKSKGFDIQLDPIGENDVAVAGTLTLKGSWENPGKSVDLIDSEGDRYPGFTKNATVYNVDGNNVVHLHTDPETGYKVFIAPTGEAVSGTDAYDIAARLTPGASATTEDFTKVHMPKVDLDDKGGLDALIGMRNNMGGQITQAQMQTVLKMNETGFDARQGIAAAATRGGSFDPTFKVDQPFVMWVQYPGMDKPLIAIPVDRDSWKDPGKLEQ